MTTTMEQQIREIPGEGGWWKSGDKDDAMEVAEEMLKNGIRGKLVVDWIRRIYNATANEFGS